MNGKGDKRRPMEISYDGWERNYENIFPERNFSQCCNAPPFGLLSDIEGELTGRCSRCGEISTFWDEDMEDYADQIEYLVEHQ